MTFMLLVASVWAMLIFQLFRRQARRRALLVGMGAVGYLALFVLRMEFLITVGKEALVPAILQAAMLIAISAALVLCGSAVLARLPSRLTQRPLAGVGWADQREHSVATPPADDTQAPVRTPLAHREVIENVLLPGHRSLGRLVGAALVGLLVVLDIVPLLWSAEAFGLGSASTWLVTAILLVLSVGAMLGFQLTRRHARQRALLVGMVVAGYLALLMLHIEFLITVGKQALLPAILQATLLTATSAALVLCASAALARIPPRPTGKGDHARRVRLSNSAAGHDGQA